MLFFREKLFSAMKVIPVRPANIKKMMIIFPEFERRPVIPFESPTVANAENASKIRLDSEKIPFLIDFCSEMRSKITITERKQIAFIKIEVAFEVDDSEMSR